MPAPIDVPSIVQGTALALYALCQAGLVAYSAHRWPMLAGGDPPPPPPGPWWVEGEEPHVLVQLPVYEEPAVVGRLVAAAAALEWPRDRLEIQLLDDSESAAAAMGARAVARARERGVSVRHLRRARRAGFKAGALAAGLAISSADFVAVFDADFVPDPDFLRRMLPSFADPDVGLVQARWGHLNRDANALTRAQAAMLDAHFLLEHAWRQRNGRYLSFNGTAGVWRRACIESAGGWSADTLTEDLDLSYRAQLAGWRFAFRPDVVVPAELPVGMVAFRSQQHRWAKGALQTARKLLPRIARARLPWRTKLEAFVHLTANVTYPLLLALALLIAPVLWPARLEAPPWLPLLQLAIVAAGTFPVALFLARGQRLAGRRGWRLGADTALALLLCGGLCWHLARAVAEGMGRARGEFVRTPKTGTGGAARARVAPAGGHGASPSPRGAAELALASAFAPLAALAGLDGRPAAMPFLLVLAAGLAWVGASAAVRGARS